MDFCADMWQRWISVRSVRTEEVSPRLPRWRLLPATGVISQPAACQRISSGRSHFPFSSYFQLKCTATTVQQEGADVKGYIYLLLHFSLSMSTRPDEMRHADASRAAECLSTSHVSRGVDPALIDQWGAACRALKELPQNEPVDTPAACLSMLVIVRRHPLADFEFLSRWDGRTFVVTSDGGELGLRLRKENGFYTRAVRVLPTPDVFTTQQHSLRGPSRRWSTTAHMAFPRSFRDGTRAFLGCLARLCPRLPRELLEAIIALSAPDVADDRVGHAAGSNDLCFTGAWRAQKKRRLGLQSAQAHTTARLRRPRRGAGRFGGGMRYHEGGAGVVAT